MFAVRFLDRPLLAHVRNKCGYLSDWKLDAHTSHPTPEPAIGSAFASPSLASGSIVVEGERWLVI